MSLITQSTRIHHPAAAATRRIQCSVTMNSSSEENKTNVDMQNIGPTVIVVREYIIMPSEAEHAVGAAFTFVWY